MAENYMVLGASCKINNLYIAYVREYVLTYPKN